MEKERTYFKRFDPGERTVEDNMIDVLARIPARTSGRRHDILSYKL